MTALKILKERLIDLERISKMYQSTQVQVDILETKVAIAELEVLQQPKSCEGCSADCSAKDALNTHGQYWDYPSDIGCKSRYEPKGAMR